MGFKTKTFLNNNPPELEDDDLNAYKDEFNNVITSSSQTPDNGILDQTAKGIATYVARGDFYSDSGAPNAYVLSIVGALLPPLVYATGMRVRFIVANSNTGASTVNVASLGVKDIKNSFGGDLRSDQLQTGDSIELEYDGTDFLAKNIRQVFETKILAANETADVKMADLTYALTIGRLYRITGQFRFNEINAGGNFMRVLIRDTSTVIHELSLEHEPTGDTAIVVLSFTILYRMVTTELNFTTLNLSGGENIGGNGTTEQTFVQVTEVDKSLISGAVI